MSIRQDTSCAEQDQLDFYIQNQAEFVKLYNGKIIAIHDKEVKGTYSSKVQALQDMLSRAFAPGSFLIILCVDGESEYMRRYHSRADFPTDRQRAFA